MRVRLWLVWDHWTRIKPERAAVTIAGWMPDWLVKWVVVRAACKVEPRFNPSDVTAKQMADAFR